MLLLVVPIQIAFPVGGIFAPIYRAVERRAFRIRLRDWTIGRASILSIDERHRDWVRMGGYHMGVEGIKVRERQRTQLTPLTRVDRRRCRRIGRDLWLQNGRIVFVGVLLGDLVGFRKRRTYILRFRIGRET